MNWHLVPVAKNTLPSALSLWVNDLVSRLLGLCYVSGIVSLSQHLSQFLDMVLLEVLSPAALKNDAKSASLCSIDAEGSGSN